MKRTALALILIVVFSSSLIGVVQRVKSISKTIIVPDDYATIQAAVDKASQGDIVLVKAGKYELAEGQILVINKSISLVGENPNNTIITLRPRLIEPTLPFALPTYEGSIKIDANDVQLSGFTINHTGDSGGRLSVNKMRNHVANNILAVPLSLSGSDNNVSLNIVRQTIGCYGSNNTISANRIVGYGVVVMGTGSSLIQGNTITDCSTESAGYGVRLDVGGNTVLDNIIMDCTHAISILGESSSNIIYNNTVTSNIGGLEIFGQGSNNVFNSNYVANNGYGVLVSYTSMGAPGENNTVYHNNFVDNTEQVDTGTTYLGNYGAVVSTYHIGAFDYSEEGNYWSDYTGSDSNGDGIGDTPYAIDDNRRDNYPLMLPLDMENNSIVIPSNTPSTSNFNLLAASTAALVSVIIVVTCLLIHYKKRREKTESTT